MALTIKKLIFLSALLTFSLAFGQVKTVCPAGFSFIGEKCYFVSYEKANWFNADRKCHNLKSSLVIFDDDKDRQLLTATLKVLGLPFTNSWQDSIWTGLTSLGMDCNFVRSRNGKAVPYTPWSPNQPNPIARKDCVAYANYNGFGYHNIECEPYEFPFACEAKTLVTEKYLCLRKEEFLEVDINIL